MKEKILAIFLIFLLSLTPALAVTYIIEHDDEVDQVMAMREQSAGRQDYNSELTQLRQEVEDLRTQYAHQESNRVEQDYYNGLSRRYNNRCDYNDMNDLNHLLDDKNLTTNERRDLQRLLDRCNNGYGNFFDNYAQDCRTNGFDYLNYADNFQYNDYLDDVYHVSRCRRLYLHEDVFNDYLNDFGNRYKNHNTSYNPYTDVLHELNDADFYKYGPGAYKEWGAWCESNRYRDGSFPRWCYERQRFITDVKWV